MRQLTADEIRDYQIDLLLFFDNLCKERKLQYCLGGGTLLGAIRHQGFIPWDDDIDVMMPRKDFERLLEMSRDFKDSSRYGIISWQTGDSPYPFIKIINKQTIVKEKYMDRKYTISIWIDVFPMDVLPKEDKIVKRLFHQTRVRRFLLEMAISEPGKGTTISAGLVKTIIVPILRHLDTDHICEQMHKTAKRYQKMDTPYIGSLLWGYGPQERVPTSFFDPVMVEFEGHLFPGPKCWDQYLAQLYGDYMKLPPENKRIRHDFEAWVEEGC